MITYLHFLSLILVFLIWTVSIALEKDFLTFIATIVIIAMGLAIVVRNIIAKHQCRIRQKENRDHYVVFDKIWIDRKVWALLKKMTGIMDDKDLLKHCLETAYNATPNSLPSEMRIKLKAATGIKDDQILLSYCLNLASHITFHLQNNRAVFAGTYWQTELQETRSRDILSRHQIEDLTTSKS